MHNIDWPLAITLAVVFVVMSIVRWRYFRSVARRRARRAEASSDVDRTDPPAP
jgi:hypothetical protein